MMEQWIFFAERCALNWESSDGSCFRFFSDIKKTWADARKHCFGVDGWLATVQKQNHFEFLVDQMQKTTPSYNHWVGAKNVSGNYYWTGCTDDDRAVSFGIGPGAGLNGECLQLMGNNWSDQEAHFLLDDQPCGPGKKRFICEQDEIYRPVI